MLVESDGQGRLIRLRGNPAHPYSRGTLCQKTAAFGDLVHSRERLTRPWVRGADGALAPASWEEALDRVAVAIERAAPERILGLSYAGSMGILARKFPLRTMHALGATLHDAGICDATSTAGWEAVMGRAVGCDLAEVEHSDALVLWGCEAARTHQHLLPAIRALCRRGVPVVAIDIWRSDTIRRLERWGGRGLLVRPGTDAALALGAMRLALEEDLWDRAFLELECAGADELEREVRAGHDPAWVEEVAGVRERDLCALVELLARAERPFLKLGIGWTRRRNGGMAMRAVCSLAAVLGIAERTHYESGDHFGLAEEVVERPDLRPAGAPRRVVPQVTLGPALEAGEFDVVLVWGHDPAVTLPDSGAVRRGLARQDTFLVVHEQFLTETAALADVVLPATTFVEQTDVYRSYGHRVLQLGRAACRPPGEARSNVATFAALAGRLGLPEPCRERDEEALCRALLEASAERLGREGLERVWTGEPTKLPPRVLEGRGTPSGRIELASEACERAGLPRTACWKSEEDPRDTGEWRLFCAPSIATHNSTYNHSPRHLRRRGAVRAHLAPADAERLGVREGDRVRLSNARGALSYPAAIDDALPAGLVRIDGLPRADDAPEGAGINLLTPSDLADMANGNVYLSTRIDLERLDSAGRSAAPSGHGAARGADGRKGGTIPPLP